MYCLDEERNGYFEEQVFRRREEIQIRNLCNEWSQQASQVCYDTSLRPNHHQVIAEPDKGIVGA